MASYLPSIIDALSSEKDVIRALQMLSIVANKETVVLPGLCPMVMGVFAKVVYSKNALVRDTGISVMKQINSLLFSLLTLKDAELETSDLFHVCAKQFIYFTKTASERTTPLLLLLVSIDGVFTLLHERSSAILKSKSFNGELTASLLPALQSYLKNVSTPFPLLYRVMRLSAKLMVHSSKFFSLLLPIMSKLNSGTNCYIYLALESLSMVLSLPSNVAVSLSKINNSRLLTEILIELNNLVKKLGAHGNVVKNKKVAIIKSMRNVMNVEDLNVLEPPVIDRHSFASLILEILLESVQGIEDLLLQEQIACGEIYETAFTQRQLEDLIIPLKENWGQAHELFLALLKDTKDENTIQRILKGMKSLVNITGTVRLTPQMYTTLKALCHLSLPLELSTPQITNSHLHGLHAGGLDKASDIQKPLDLQRNLQHSAELQQAL